MMNDIQIKMTRVTRNRTQNEGDKVYALVKYIEHIFGTNDDTDIVVSSSDLDKQATIYEKQALSVNKYNKILCKSKSPPKKNVHMRSNQKDMPYYQRRK